MTTVPSMSLPSAVLTHPVRVPPTSGVSVSVVLAGSVTEASLELVTVMSPVIFQFPSSKPFWVSATR